MTELMMGFGAGAAVAAFAFYGRAALAARRLRRFVAELERHPLAPHQELALVEIEGSGTHQATLARYGGAALLITLRVPADWACGRPTLIQAEQRDKLLLLRGGEAAEVRVVSHPLYNPFAAYLFPDGELRVVMVPHGEPSHGA